MVDARPGDDRVPHALLSRLLRQVLRAHRARRCRPVSATSWRSCCPSSAGSAPRSRSANNMRFINAVEALLRQARGEGLAGLVLDDLQFADAASVEVLQHLAAAGIGLRWIVAFRPDELSPAARHFHDEFLGAGGARLHRAAAARDGADRRADRFARRRRAGLGAARAGPRPAQRRQPAVPARDPEADAGAGRRQHAGGTGSGARRRGCRPQSTSAA